MVPKRFEFLTSQIRRKLRVAGFEPATPLVTIEVMPRPLFRLNYDPPILVVEHR